MSNPLLKMGKDQIMQIEESLTLTYDRRDIVVHCDAEVALRVDESMSTIVLDLCKVLAV